MRTTFLSAGLVFRALICYSCMALALASSAFALDQVVSVQGPVEVVESTTVPGQTIYWVKDPRQVRYQVVVPDSERERFVAAVRNSPATVIRFDGTVVDNDSRHVLNVNKWSTITTTTTDSFGNTETRKTTTITR